MFKRFFGETEVEQLSFLQSRVTITFVLIVVGLIGAIFSRTFGLVAVIPFIFIWGKGALSALFGITSIAVFFTSNLIIGVLLCFLYFIAVYLAGLVCAFIGIGRWIYLKVKQSKGLLE